MTLKRTLALATIMLPATVGTALADDYCREYQKEITIGGEVVRSYGTACQQPDGSWKLEEDTRQSARPQRKKASKKVKVVTHASAPSTVYKHVYYAPNHTKVVTIKHRNPRQGRHYSRHRSFHKAHHHSRRFRVSDNAWHVSWR